MTVKARTFIPVMAASTVAGWFLPSFWERRETPPPMHRIAPANSVTAGTAQSLAARVKSAGGLMAQIQTIVAGVPGTGRSLAAAAAARSLPSFSCDLTEELALRLAGEELASDVKDGPAFLRSLKDADGHVLAGALAAWAAKDPEGALRAIMTPEGLKIANSEDVLIKDLAEKFPDKALHLLQTAQVPGTDMDNGWWAVLRAFARKDAPLALDALRTAPYSVRKTGMDTILLALAEKDPRAALEWRKGLSPEFQGLSTTDPIFQEWVVNDPAGVAAAWKEYGKDVSGEVLASRWALVDPEAAIKWASENEACEHPEEFITEAIATLAEKDPKRALAVLEMLKEEDREQGVRQLASKWTTRDFPAALAWAKDLGDPAERKAAFTAMSNAAGELPPAQRRALIAEAGEHTSNGFQILWGLDQKEALKGFAALPPDEQSAVWGSLSAAIVNASPQEASQLPIPDETTAGEVVPCIAGAWAKTDAAKAAAWVETLKEEGDTQKLAAQNLIAVWSRNEPEAAAAWTESLPDSPAKDAALDQLAVTAFKAGDHAEAMRWSLSITDAGRRQDSLHERYREWTEIDPVAAKAAVEALPFDDAGKKGVIDNVKEVVIEEEENDSGQ